MYSCCFLEGVFSALKISTTSYKSKKKNSTSFHYFHSIYQDYQSSLVLPLIMATPFH